MKRAAVFMLLFCLGCSAQSAAPGPDANDLRIKRMVRNFRHLRDDVGVSVGARKPSQFAGYDELPVTLSKGTFSKTETYYISKDGQKLVQVVPVPDPMADINLAGRPARGAADAKVLVVVYDDFQCPYCRLYYQTFFGEVMKEYADKIRVVFKDYPLTMHPWASHAAIDSECLAAQNGSAYWDFSDYVHANQKEITGQGRPLAEQFAALDKLTADLGQKHSLDAAQLKACVARQDHTQLDASVKEGDNLGVDGTPAIFINGQKLEGAVPASDLRTTLDTALRDAGQMPPPHAAPAASNVPPAPDPSK